MKLVQTLFFIFLLAISLLAQETKWTRVESENQEVSASFPPNFLVNADTKESGQRYQIVGFQNGVKIEMVIYKDGDARGRLGRMRPPNDAETKTFKSQGFPGRNVITNKKRYVSSFYIASDDYFYFLNVSAPNSEKAEVTRFLYSIKLKGKPLVVKKDAVEPDDEIVSVTALKSSPEVIAALNRKTEKIKNKISYELESQGEEEAPDESLRPAIVVARQRPNFPRPNFNGIPQNASYRIKIRAKLLANGQVGDMTVYSSAERSLINSCVEAVKKTKFVPAQKDGNPVDYEYTFDYSFEVFTSTQIFSFPGIIPN